jgi:hypothetical protein
MNDEEFFRYHHKELWDPLSGLAMAKASEMVLSVLEGTITGNFNELIRTGNYQKAQDIEKEAIKRILDRMSQVFNEAIPIAADFHKNLFGNRQID